MKYVPPYITVDVDTNKRIVHQRTNSLEVAFARGEKFVDRNPSKDYVVIDGNLRPVPRPKWMVI